MTLRTSASACAIDLVEDAVCVATGGRVDVGEHRGRRSG